MRYSEALAIIVPTFSVWVGILLNRNNWRRLDARITSFKDRMVIEIHFLREEIGKLRDEVRSILDDQREFHRSLGEQEVRLIGPEEE